MALLPVRTIFDGTGTPTTSAMKTALGGLRDYLAGLLGTSGLVTDAVAALGLWGVVTYTTTATQPTTDLGKTVRVNSASTFSLTLPTMTGMPAGAQINFVNIGTAAVNIASPVTTGSPSIFPGTVYTISLPAGASAQATYDGTNWIVLIAQATATASVRGLVKNFTASCTGTTANVTMAADEVVVESATNVFTTLRSVSLTLNSAAAGANGLDTGTLAASTWYYMFVIWNGTAIASLASTSPVAPTLPSGYTGFARVGAFRTDATASKFPLSAVWYGRRGQYKVAAGSNVAALPIMASGTAGSITVPTWAAVSVLGSFVPPTAAAIVLSQLWGAGAVTWIAAPNNAYGAFNSTTNAPPLTFATGGSGGANFVPTLMLLESANIFWASSAANVGLTCFGWEDNI